MSGTDITAVILAGGLGRRMQGRDKGLLSIDGIPLAARIHAAIAPQVDHVLINANRNQSTYAAIGPPVVADVIGGRPGPLAGFLTGLEHCDTALLLTVPCDSPWIAPSLAARLRAGLDEAQADVAVVHDGERLQPVFALMRRDRVRPGLREALAAGQRRVDGWLSGQRWTGVDFSDAQRCFVNVNTPEDYAAAQPPGSP